METQERILSAALHFDMKYHFDNQPTNIKTGLVVGGLSHRQCYMIDVLFNFALDVTSVTEGFLTSHQRFVDRAEAASIAKAAHQIHDEHIVYLKSEDILPSQTESRQNKD